YGGSERTRKSTMLIDKAHEPEATEQASGQSKVRVTGAGIPPRTAVIISRHTGTVGTETEAAKFPHPHARAFPLPPDQTAQFAPEPAIQHLKMPFHLAQPEVGHPTPDDRGQGGDHATERAAASPTKDLTQFGLEPFD